MSNVLKTLSRGGAAGAETDPNFNQTVLLLKGDGNQGANNLYNPGPPRYLAFTDNSTNNFPITVNGDAYGDNFSPFMVEEGQWSNYFDGSGDYLSGPTDNAISTFTGDFTIEMWANFNSIAASSGLMQCLQAGPPELGWQFYWRQANTSFRLYSSALGSFDFSYTPTVGSWIHIALSRSGTSLRCFVNGTQVGTTQTMSGTVTRSTVNSLQIGGGSYGITSINGYLSNVRLVNGTAVYTAAFTPPTTPLTAITNTSLLTCQSNRFVDNSTNNFTITRNGDVSVKPFNPFTTTYNSTDGSGYFDGSGDYLQTTSTQIIPASTTYTIEAWVYLTGSYADYREIVCQGTSGNAGRIILFVDITSGELRVQFGSTGIASGVTIVPNQWYYIAFRNNGGSYNLYVNGVSVASGTNTTTPQNTSLTIGAFSSGAEYWQGYISNVRISNTARTITLPTASFSSDANTRLLTCQYQGSVRNVGFIDSSPYDHVITRNGNTTQGTFSPFSVGAGEWSNYFDGSGDTLTAADNAAFDLGSGDWTIEFWANFGSVSGEKGLVSHFATPALSTGYTLRLSTGNSPSGLRLVCSSGVGTDVILQAAWSPVVSVWYHIAAVRDGGTLRLYVDGVQIGSTSIAITIGNPSTTFAVGTAQTVASSDMNGYISNVRLVKGTCLYTGGTTFTPPTAPLTAISGTSLLTCQSNRFVDNSTNAFAITRNGDVRVTPFSPFAPTAAYSAGTNGGSGYFDGSGDWLSIAHNSSLTPTGDFTIEFWAYPTSSTGLQEWYAKGALQLYISNAQWKCALSANNTSTYFFAEGNISVITNAWAHIAITRSGNDYKFFVNGVQSGSTVTSASAPSTGTDVLQIGSYTYGVTAYPAFGYISGVRYLNGTGYSSISVPTAPPTAITNTSLLCNFTNAGIFDNTGKNNLETVGNAQIDTTTKKFGTGSMEFDGTGDYLIMKDTPEMAFGSGDFTIEMWLYRNASNVQHDIIAFNPTSTNGAYPALYISSGNALFYYTDGANRITGGTINTGQWYHIALTRSGTSTRLFIDGTQSGSTFTDTYVYLCGANRPVIGSAGFNISGSFNGYIDDLRITKGVARYTANFTPPIKELPDL